MKKNKLFTIFAAVTMLASTGSALLSENTNKRFKPLREKLKRPKRQRKLRELKRLKKQQINVLMFA